MPRQYDVDQTPVENPLSGCKGISLALGFSGIAVIVILIVLFFMTLNVEAVTAGCNYFDGDLEDVWDVPLGNTNHCDEQAEIRLVGCSVVITSFIDNYYFIREHPDGILRYDVHVNAGGSTSFRITEGMQFVDIFGDYGLVGIVDYPTECDDSETVAVYPNDDRVNWQQGDHFAKVYVDNGSISIYNVETGTGELALQIDIETFIDFVCTEDYSICLYRLDTGEIQANIVDREGKFYELIIYSETDI